MFRIIWILRRGDPFCLSLVLTRLYVTRTLLVTSTCSISPSFFFIVDELSRRQLSSESSIQDLPKQTLLSFYSRRALVPWSLNDSFEAASVSQYLTASGYECCLDTREIARREPSRSEQCARVQAWTVNRRKRREFVAALGLDVRTRAS